jgi:dTDP-glucose 4,6-dehydratase
VTRLLVTGGSGFLGSSLVRRWVREGRGEVLNLDLLTYAGSEARVAEVAGSPAYGFVRADVADRRAVERALREFGPRAVVHFAAESHVTRGERDAPRFWRSNVEGTRVLLEAAEAAGVARFVHVSTDEVYGPIAEGAFREGDKAPGEGRATSAYARSKAVADDLATTFRGRMEVVVLRPTNCFGPWQHPEKAFARWVTRALRGRPLPVWGDGRQVRQWLHAEDLTSAVLLVLESSRPERVYNVAPRHDPEIENAELARWVCRYLGLPEDRVVLTAYDRPDHDRRYAVDPSRLEGLGWRPAGDVWERFAETVEWYRREEGWWGPLVPEAESLYDEQEAR